MKTMPLGRTGLTVPQLCLGTMTMGTQVSQIAAFTQMDMCVERGVHFLDTAELYSTVPMSQKVQGESERIIGRWLAARKRRDDVIIATKVAGRGAQYVRDGGKITPQSIKMAVETSLERLRTDYIDLYQLHWPNRGHYHFRQQWTYDATGQDTGTVETHISEVLQALGDLITAGKIRAIGLSNETVWGTMKFLQAAEAHGLPRVATVQNEYSLLYRAHDTDFAELSHHEDVGLLSYSPLAGGMLSGKYSGGTMPKGSRGAINKGIGGRQTEAALAAADAYAALARAHGLDPSGMALAWCLTRPFMASAIFGATTPTQLEVALDAADLVLSDEVMVGIAALHRQYPIPY